MADRNNGIYEKTPKKVINLDEDFFQMQPWKYNDIFAILERLDVF